MPNRIATVAWGMIETKDLFSSNFLNYRPSGNADKSNFALSPDRKWLAWTAAIVGCRKIEDALKGRINTGKMAESSLEGGD